MNYLYNPLLKVTTRNRVFLRFNRQHTNGMLHVIMSTYLYIIGEDVSLPEELYNMPYGNPSDLMISDSLQFVIGYGAWSARNRMDGF
jgi:hypothetical protein